MFLTFFISIIDGYNALLGSVPAVEVGALNAISEFYQTYLPLYDLGLGWIVPAVVGAVIGYIFSMMKR